MFGGTKPTFGAATTGTGFGAFNNTATASPFAQPAFGKPAASAFGAAPTFGTQQTTPSMFGSNAAQPQANGLFGGASTSTAFGATTSTQPAFGNSLQPQAQANSSSLFGQPAASSLSGQSAISSVFGSAVKPTGLGTFGQTGAQPSSSLFGQPAASASTSGFGTFGEAAPTTTSVFGSATTSAFGQPGKAATAVNPGTSIAKYQPTNGTDTIMENGRSNNVKTKEHSITAMQEYEGKSLEELRMEDYLANRKGSLAGATGSFGGFRATTQATTGTGVFGATFQPSTGLLGSTTTASGQPATGGFGGTAAQPFTAKPFGATGTDNLNPFDAAQHQANSSSLSGQPAVSSAFGSAVKPTGMGTFGQTGAQPSSSLFGQPAASASTSGFGTFGEAAPTTTSVFGSATTSAFGQPGKAATAVNPGTSIAKYQPTNGTDTIMENGRSNNVETKEHSITAMQEYEGKSLEELRMEDYLANRKGSLAGATGSFGGFRATTQATTGTGVFGATFQPSTGLFGSTTTASGQPATGGFGGTAAQPFTAKPFGATGTDNLNPFDAAQHQANSSSLSGQPAVSSAFGSAVKPTGMGTFGQTGAQPSSSLFGQPAASASTSGFGTFGEAAPTTTSVFGSATTSAFGQPGKAATAVNPGTSIAKYQPTNGTDTIMENGRSNNVKTKEHSITAMQEYEGKSLEELRMEDYLANRKGSLAGATGSFGVFGATTQATTGTGVFSATSPPSTGLFAQSAVGSTENKGLFGSTTSALGQPTTGGFGGTTTQPFGANPFGAANTSGFGATGTDNINPFRAKPDLGQSAAPSGQTTATSTAPPVNLTLFSFNFIKSLFILNTNH